MLETSDKLLSTFFSQRQALTRFLVRKTGCTELASDLVQDAWLRIADNPKTQVVSNPRAYLFRIAANLAHDHGRRQRALPLTDDTEAALRHMPDTAPSPEAVARGREELAILEAAIRKLPPRCREVFMLARIDDLTYAEIGARLGMSPKTAFSHMTKALSHLKLAMAQANGDPVSEKMPSRSS